MMKSYRVDCIVALTCILCALAASGQTPPPPQESGMLQQMQQATAANERQLRTYQWIEATTVTTDGKALPAKQSICRYAADGTLLKTPLGPQQAQAAGRRGPMRRLIADEKKDKIKEDIEATRALSQLYLPFNHAHLKEAVTSGKVSVEHNASDSNTIVLSDYAKPGDQLRLTLNRTTMQIDRITVHTYFDKPKDAMTMDLSFSTLPDGTLYPALNTINAPSKKLTIATVNSNYSKPMN